MNRLLISMFAAAVVFGCGGVPWSSDLAVVSVSVPGGTYGCADALTVDSSVTNNGPDACSSYTVGFYLSTDTNITLADVSIGSFSRMTGLPAGLTDARSDPVSWTSVSPGSYYIGMIRTSGSDPDSSNDTGYDPTPITIVRMFCDLEVISVDAVDLPCGTTDTSFVDVVVQNNGPDACSAYRADFYLSTDAVITYSDTLIGGTSRWTGLSSGSTDVFQSAVHWEGLTVGSYYIGMIVTYDDDPDASNNTGCDPVATVIVQNDFGYEPNNILVSASSLGAAPLNVGLAGYIWTTGDEDWYRVGAVTGNVLTIGLASLPANYDLRLYDSSGGLLAASINAGTTDEVITHTCLADGDYYIQVIGVAGAWNSVDPYWLIVVGL